MGVIKSFHHFKYEMIYKWNLAPIKYQIIRILSNVKANIWFLLLLVNDIAIDKTIYNNEIETKNNEPKSQKML